MVAQSVSIPSRTRSPVGALLVCLALLLGGCATPPVKLARTTVVLMPDEDGNVGAVTLSTDGGTRRIDEAWSASTVEGSNARPSESKAIGLESVTSSYDALLRAQPLKPKSFVLHFVLDKTVLTEESKALIPAVLQAVRERKPTEITIFGHADATGTEPHNVKLAAERARVVANLLRKTDPTLDRIDVQSFGDKVPLFPSDGRTPEPRNRRAEIMIL